MPLESEKESAVPISPGTATGVLNKKNIQVDWKLRGSVSHFPPIMHSVPCPFWRATVKGKWQQDMVRQVGLEKALLIYMNPAVSMYLYGVM